MQAIVKNKTELFLSAVLLVCLVAGLVLSYQTSLQEDPDRVARKISSNLEQQLAKLDPVVNGFITDWNNSHTLTLRKQDNVDFIAVVNQEVNLWTGSRFIPNIRVLIDEFSLKHIKTGAGDFLLRKWKMSENRSLVAIIPLHIHYKIQNEYLEHSWNPDIFSGYRVEIHENTAIHGHGVEVNGSPVFRVVSSAGENHDTTNGIGATLFFTVSIFTFFVLLVRLSSNWRLQHPAAGFLLLAGCIVAVRYLMIAFRFPARFVDTVLFDPKHFASSDLNPSMGDMFLNLIGVSILCFFLLRNFFRFEKLRNAFRTKVSNGLFSVFAVLAILFGALFPLVVIQTIYNNSAITLNISESVYFDELRVLAMGSVILAWISSFLFMHVFIRILMNDKNLVRLGLGILTGVVLFVLINEWSGQLYISSLVIGLAYLLVNAVFRLYKSLQRFRYVTFVYFFTAVLIFSINSLVAVQHYNKVRKTNDQLRFASSFLIDRDDFGEFLLNEAAQKIGNDLFIQTRLSGPFINKDAVRQKIRQVFIPGYFNKYNIDIHLFSGTGDALDESMELNLDDWFSDYQSAASSTGYEGIYFINRPHTESARAYVVIIPVRRNEFSAGYAVLELSLKRIIPDNVYPELLVDNRFQQTYRAQDFSYAVFLSGEIQFQSGDFNYNFLHRNALENPRFLSSGLEFMGFHHVGSKDPSGRLVVVSSPETPWIIRVADFSFFMVLGLCAIMLYLLVFGVMDYLEHERLMLAARIQLILNLSFFVPLIAVSVITLGLTARTTQEQLNSDYLAKSGNFAGEISVLLGDTQQADILTSEQNFVQLASIMNLDANMFTPQGRLQFSSQPLIFDNSLLAPYINPVAMQRIRKGERTFIEDERVGKLSYNVAYSALNSPSDGRLLGIAAIPFFQSAHSLEKMQITVLSNILSIFTAVFILLLFISYWVSTWLTFPLRMITQKLGRISLTRSNQPLEWHSEDEIGLMVREYNQMLSTLSESKKELERTQRERAWREIAQQVAHEIKNPLTPMKLALQKLERLTDDDPQKYEKIQKAIASILSQVDTLDGVASSFSAFAKMPEPVMRRVELVDLLKNTINLHRQSVPIEFSSDITEAFIQADEQLLGRIFSNLVLNSIQAARQDFPVNIEIAVKQNENHVRISFSDNGTGIEESLQDKIFLPHFSTKRSGSGLGLAIAKQGIEQMGGSIFFESTVGKGTVFYIDLPFAE